MAVGKLVTPSWRLRDDARACFHRPAYGAFQEQERGSVSVGVRRSHRLRHRFHIGLSAILEAKTVTC